MALGGGSRPASVARSREWPPYRVGRARQPTYQQAMLANGKNQPMTDDTKKDPPMKMPQPV